MHNRQIQREKNFGCISTTLDKEDDMRIMFEKAYVLFCWLLFSSFSAVWGGLRPRPKAGGGISRDSDRIWYDSNLHIPVTASEGSAGTAGAAGRTYRSILTSSSAYQWRPSPRRWYQRFGRFGLDQRPWTPSRQTINIDIFFWKA